MRGPEKLKDWMQRKAILSTWELAKELEVRMKPDFPSGFKKGDKIHQSDISEAMNAVSAFKFKKVTSAIVKYFSLPEGYFGDFSNADKSEALSEVQEERDQYLQKSIDLSDKLIEASAENLALQKENIALLKRCHEMERDCLRRDEIESENQALRTRVNELESENQRLRTRLDELEKRQG